MKYAVIDTETSGLFQWDKPADAEGQPRLASLGLVLLADDLTVESETEILVKPEGWEMGAEAGAVNGLTMERLNAEGQPILAVLARYTEIIQAGYVLASFNCQYDSKIMRGELRRAGLPDMFETTPNICLMRAATDVCCVPKKSGKGWKFPKLQEACAFFKIEQPAAHSALGDARSAKDILLALHVLGKLSEAQVHYAVNRPTAEAPKTEATSAS